jgi:hypothetical protein
VRRSDRDEHSLCSFEDGVVGLLLPALTVQTGGKHFKKGRSAYCKSKRRFVCSFWPVGSPELNGNATTPTNCRASCDLFELMEEDAPNSELPSNPERPDITT